MSNSENIIGFGPNAYAKPATALNILRETVMGRELFDFAFKTYCQRWAFKHPEPADFFRTMEDASAVDLDWFWRGWFFDIEPVDIALDTVKCFQIVKGEKVAVKWDTIVKTPKPAEPPCISTIRNQEAGIIPLVERDTALQDFYYSYREPKEISKEVRNRMEAIESMNDSEFNPYDKQYVYELTCRNKGGLVSPVIIQFMFEDGSSVTERISAYIWRKNETVFTKTFMYNKKVSSVLLDPLRETADVNERNNAFNIVAAPSRMELFKQKQAAGRGQSQGKNPMQKIIR